jgi:hypothetical protein
MHLVTAVVRKSPTVLSASRAACLLGVAFEGDRSSKLYDVRRPGKLDVGHSRRSAFPSVGNGLLSNVAAAL